ncbi:MAG: Alpha-L-rhamnosidase domain protein, partial [Candidatus Gottesmanbacteria bacterium GW2011_GWC1_43_10]
PLTVHIQAPTTAGKLFPGSSWLDIDSLQSGHAKERAAFMVDTILENQGSGRPIINLEPWYEGILGDFGAEAQRYAFWMCILAGAKGHTYGAHGLWQMAKNSDFLGHWGDSDWKQAWQLPGSAELGKGKKFLERLEWWQLKPNLGIIQPHWQVNRLDGPLAAEVGARQMLIYFPKTNKNRTYWLRLEANAAGRISWLDPRTLLVVQKQKYAGRKIKLKPPEQLGEQDALVKVKIELVAK